MEGLLYSRRYFGPWGFSSWHSRQKSLSSWSLHSSQFQEAPLGLLEEEEEEEPLLLSGRQNRPLGGAAGGRRLPWWPAWGTGALWVRFLLGNEEKRRKGHLGWTEVSESLHPSPAIFLGLALRLYLPLPARSLCAQEDQQVERPPCVGRSPNTPCPPMHSRASVLLPSSRVWWRLAWCRCRDSLAGRGMWHLPALRSLTGTQKQKGEAIRHSPEITLPGSRQRQDAGVPELPADLGVKSPH